MALLLLTGGTRCPTQAKPSARIGKATLRTLVRVVALWTLASCSNDPAQLGPTAAEDADPSLAVRAFPEFKRLVYTSRAECLICFEEHCGAEAQRCAETPECAVGVACLRDCQQPTCFVSCYAKQQAVDPNPLAIGYGATWRAMELCRDQRCGDVCKFTTDQYGCIGEFDWTDTLTGHEGSAELHVRTADLATLAPYPELVVAVCSGAPTEPCVEFDQATTDEDGHASLVYPVGLPGIVHNYLALRDPRGRVIPMLLYPPRGIFVPGVRNSMLTTTYGSEDFLPYRGWRQERFGAVMLVGLDCNGKFAQGWSFEIEHGGDQVSFVYNSPDGKQTTNSTGTAFAVNVEPGKRTVVVRRTDTGAILARRAVRIEPGVGTLLWVLPPDRVEQAALETAR